MSRITWIARVAGISRVTGIAGISPIGVTQEVDETVTHHCSKILASWGDDISIPEGPPADPMALR
jgi:hypothetical protein